MNQKKLITLDSFIDEALYDKRTGYYMKKSPFGKKGDFITAPGISILFSEMITIWVILYWESLGKPKKFNIVARHKDQSIEMAEHKHKRISCIMFHPERKNGSQKQVDNFFKLFFNIK